MTDRSSVLPFCPNRTEQVNQSSVSQTETEQNRTCKKRIKNLDLNCRSNKQTNNFNQLGVKPRSNKQTTVLSYYDNFGSVGILLFILPEKWKCIVHFWTVIEHQILKGCEKERKFNS